MDVTMNAPPFAKLAMIACPALSTAALAKNRAKKGTIASIKINLNPAMDMSCKIVSSVDFLVVFNKNFLNPLNDPFFGILLIWVRTEASVLGCQDVETVDCVTRKRQTRS